METYYQIAKELAAGGFATFLVVVLLAGKYKIWVWGYILEDVIKEKDRQIESERLQKEEFKRMLFAARNLADRTVEVANKALSGGA